MKYLAVATFLACALFCANAYSHVLNVPDSLATLGSVIDEKEDHVGDYEDLLPFPSDRKLMDFKDCLMNCSLGVLECFKGDSTGHECLKELYECSQECKEFGYNKEEDNESIDDEYEEFGNDYEDEEEYDDELDDEVEEDDDVDDDEDADDDDDVDDDDDDEETDEDDDDDDDNDEESDEDEDDDNDDDDEVDDDDDDEEENEFDGGSDDWLRRRKRGARGRGNLRCKLLCRRKVSRCLKKGRTGKCTREFIMCLKNCSGGKRPRPYLPRPFPPRPFPPRPKFRNCWRKCNISLSQCIKDNSNHTECIKNFKSCLMKNCSRSGSFPTLRKFMRLRPYLPRPFPPRPKLRNCWRKCYISLSQCIKDNSNHTECIKNFKSCLMKLIKKPSEQQTSRLSSLISKGKQVLQRIQNSKGKRPKIPNVTGGLKKQYQKRKRYFNQFG